MRLAVLDVEMLARPDRLDIAARYDGAVVLLRIDGRPVGEAIVSAERARRTSASELLLNAANSSFYEAWLRYCLGLPDEAPSPPRLPSGTIAICTRNRTDDLRRCLASLTAMPDPPRILVIDNAPSDERTRDLVAATQGVDYHRENRPGLDVARNAALRLATTEVVAFIDDDAVADSNWFRTLLRNFDDPLVLASTGLTLALELESDAQIAFQKFGGFTRGFKRIVYDASMVDPIDAWRAGAGVNMALRRSLVDRIGPFDEALDAGTRTLAGGDSDMFRRIVTAGHRIVYDPQALNWHCHRRTMNELEHQIFGYEVAALAILTKMLVYERNPRALIGFGRWLKREAPRVARALGERPDLPFRPSVTRVRGACAGPLRYINARRLSRS